MGSAVPLHILGAGSIGLLWASSIRSKYAKYPLTLLLRQHHKPRIQGDGTVNVSLSRSEDARRCELQIPAQIISEYMKLPNLIENLIVTTKSYQAAGAIESVQKQLHPGCKVILMCNGALSVRDKLQKFPLKDVDPKILLATTTHGAYQGSLDDADISSDEPKKSSGYSIVHAGVGRTIIEDYDGIESISKAWNESGLACSIVSNEAMEIQLWQKLAVSCTINPLTALWKCRNGELLMDPSFPIILEELVTEISAVAIQSAPPGYDDELSVRALGDVVYRVIQETSQNKSSMLQDVLRNSRTEVDHLNGYVVQRGRALGLECQANEDICGRIQALR